MNRGRLVVILLALGAVAVALVASSGGGGSKGGGSAAKPSSGDTRITFLYSPEKEALVKSLVERFNREDHGIFVDAKNVSSGEAETKIAAGRLKPDAWSPASSLWGRLLNHDADQPWAPKDNPSLMRTPLVIAMWEPLARTLGWPRKEIGFADILRLALDDRGWAAYGKPQYGHFKLGHTNPDFSTSGLSAVAAEYYATAGKKEGLTEADVTRPAVRSKIRAIERSIVHYGDTTLFFADQMLKDGAAYASAVAMEEATLVDFNRRRKPGSTKLVGIYPAEGTFFSDNPYIALDAPWAKKRAAVEFGNWLRRHIDAATAMRAGFRPGDPTKRLVAPLDAAHGVDAAEPKHLLSLPEPAVLARLKSTWRADRKPANVELVVDVSGSMGDEGKLDRARTGLLVFLRQLSSHDRIGLVSFNDKVYPLVPVQPFAQNQDALRRAIADLVPNGQTAVYDATGDGLRRVQGLGDPTRINAVVVLTDGEDTSSNADFESVRRLLASQANSEGNAVRVYTIAYGSDANSDELGALAAASGGKGFQGDTGDIESVYRSISSFF
jgi:Ca-activated chloride channel family protein